MDNQIFQSTLSNRKFASLYYVNHVEGTKWGIIVTALLSNILLPGLVLSYGIIAHVRKEAGHPIWEFLITPCAFYGSWMISVPWFEDAAECVRQYYVDSRILAFIGAAMTFLGVFCNIWIENIFLHSFLYGILGGIGTSLILSQINFVIDEASPMNMNKMKLLPLYGQALGQCTLPYIYMIIFHFYGHSMGYLLIGGLVLQILPLIMFLKNENLNSCRKSRSYSDTYKRAYSLFDDSSSLPSNINDLQLTDMSKKSWRSPSDENLLRFNNVDETNFMGDEDNNITQYNNYEHNEDDKLKTHYGVEILPKILEENEDVEDEDAKQNKENNTSDSKFPQTSIERLSATNNKFNDIIAMRKKTHTCDLATKPNKSSDDNIRSHDFFTHRHRNILLDHATYNSNKILCCYTHRMSISNCQEYIMETFLYPLESSLKTWQFYPSILLQTSSSCLFFCFSTFIVLRGFELKLNVSNVAFIISIYGISWLTFLILSPWISNLNKSNFKFVSAFGSIVSSIGLFVLLEFDVLEVIALGAALSGIGYGALSTSCHEAIRDCVGLRKWSKIKGTLQSLSGILVTAIGVWMSHLLSFNKGVDRCIEILSIMLFLSSLFWIIIIFVQTLKKHRLSDHVWPHV